MRVRERKRDSLGKEFGQREIMRKREDYKGQRDRQTNRQTDRQTGGGGGR